MSERTDSALLSAISSGDKTAIAELFQRYQVRVHRFVAAMTSDDFLAEDVVNETFMEVWKSANRFEGRSSASTWLFAIARNKAVSILRKRRELQADEGVAEAMVDPADGADMEMQQDDVSQLIRRALDKLSDEHREVIELTYYQEMSIREISEIVGCPENTVKTRMFNARRKLREIMQNQGLQGDLL